MIKPTSIPCFESLLSIKLWCMEEIKTILWWLLDKLSFSLFGKALWGKALKNTQKCVIILVGNMSDSIKGKIVLSRYFISSSQRWLYCHSELYNLHGWVMTLQSKGPFGFVGSGTLQCLLQVNTNGKCELEDIAGSNATIYSQKLVFWHFHWMIASPHKYMQIYDCSCAVPLSNPRPIKSLYMRHWDMTLLLSTFKIWTCSGYRWVLQIGVPSFSEPNSQDSCCDCLMIHSCSAPAPVRETHLQFEFSICKKDLTHGRKPAVQFKESFTLL